MSLEALEDELRKGDVGTVVATLGTTAMGAVDPLDEILALKERYGFRVHVDAAYGGYFGLIAEALDEPARRAYAAMGQADSIVIDPHKHGLQPYGCGCVLFRDPAVGRFYKHDSPYTYFTSKELHLGEISLECSRAGAAAVALWATQRLLPLKPGGEFARGSRCAGAERPWNWTEGCAATGDLRRWPAGGPELDIVVWKLKCGKRGAGFGASAKGFRCVRCAGTAPGSGAIAGIVVLGARTARRRAAPSHLPALGADEAGARGVAGRDLGTIERGVRGSPRRPAGYCERGIALIRGGLEYHIKR